MPYQIEDKLVVAVSSSALFDLKESDKIFKEKGLEEYRRFQQENQDVPFKPGVAFPFIRRLLGLNKGENESPVEVVLLSHNDPDTGLRVFSSIKSHRLSISRAAFLNGKTPHVYMESFNACLFLSQNTDDVKKAIQAGLPAGKILGAPFEDNLDDNELRVAFDFDGVLANDEAEIIFQTTRDINAFHAAEMAQADVPHGPGPLLRLFKMLAGLQSKKAFNEGDLKEPSVRIAVITARNAPSHERLVKTFRCWNVQPDETFFLGGIEKTRIIKVFRPHIFFDDQIDHLKSGSRYGAMVHVPFGIVNTSDC